MHACCAPCSLKCVESLRGEGLEPVMFWFNPNIHPLKEYKERRAALTEFCREERLELVVHGEYGLREFIAGTYPDFDNRCDFCYETRLFETAKYAAENGFTHFSTTLLISPYQKHERISEIACKAAELYRVEFLYRDFRPLFREGQAAARERGIYRQKYCGCVFSEEERYGG